MTVDKDSEVAIKHTQSYSNYRKQTSQFAFTAAVISLGFNRYKKDELFGYDEDYFDDLKMQRIGLEMLHCRIVDDFQYYISSLISEIFEIHPQAVSSGSITYKELFEADNLSGLRKASIEKVVDALGYQNILSLNEELNKKLKFSLFESTFQGYKVRRIFEIRNVIVHNQGIVSRQFANRIGSKFDTIGSIASLPKPIRTFAYLRGLARSINNRAVEKFSLEGNRNV